MMFYCISDMVLYVKAAHGAGVVILMPHEIVGSEVRELLFLIRCDEKSDQQHIENDVPIVECKTLPKT